MSFQYINQFQLPNVAQGNYQQIPLNLTQAQNYTPYNYQTSFYNTNGVLYPYYAMYQPKSSENYTFLGQQKTITDEIVYKFMLNNGQRVNIMPRKGQATIVKTFLNAGSMNETDSKRGISHTEEHMLFKGSSLLADGDVFKLTGQMGANTNASTDYAKTDYYIMAPYLDDKNLEKVIQIQGDMVSNPSNTQQALDSEKGPICSEISMMNDDVSTVAYDMAIRNLFQLQSDSKNMVAGSIATVQGLTSEDLQNHHQTFYSPQDLCTTVVGDVDVQKTIDMIAKNFTIKQTPKNQAPKPVMQLNPIQTSVRKDIKSSKAKNTSAMMAFSGYLPSDSKNDVIMALIGQYFASKSVSSLSDDLEKINAYFDMSQQKVGLLPTDPNAIIIAADFYQNNEQEGIDTIYDNIRKLQEQQLSNDDLRVLKNLLAKSLEYSLTDSSTCCDFIGVGELDKSDIFSTYQQHLQSITPQDIQQFAQKYLDLNKVSMTVVHPSSKTDDEIKANYAKSKYSATAQTKPKGNIISLCGSPKISTDSIREYKLQNNTHLAINDTNSKLCVLDWSVNTPPIVPKNPNIPAVLIGLLSKGTQYRSRKELDNFTERNAIGISVTANGRSINVSASCFGQNIDTTMQLMKELMYSPRFNKENFEKIKKDIKDALKASQKDAASNMLDNMYPGYFPSVDEKLKTIDKLTLDNVKEFYQQLLSNASSHFVATLPLKDDSTLSHKVIDSLNNSNTTFKEATPKFTPMYVKNAEPTVIYDVDDLNQAQIYKSYKFPITGNIDDEAKFEIVNMILGGTANGRLFADLREKQNLAYSVYSSIASFENAGFLSLGIQTTTDHKDQGQQSFDNVQKSLDGFDKHTKKMCEEYVSDLELESAKNQLKQNIIASTQDPYDESGLIMMNMKEPYGIKRIDKYIEAIDKVTKEDVMKAAKYIFSQKPVVSIVASQDTIDSQMEYLKTQGTVQKVAK